MFKKKLVIIGSILFIALGGMVMMNYEAFSLNEVFKSPRDRQLDYLKKHEEEIVAEIKKFYPQIETVQFDWDTLDVGPVSNGIFTTGYILSVRGSFNHLPDTVIDINCKIDKQDDIPNVTRLGFTRPRIIKDGILDSYE